MEEILNINNLNIEFEAYTGRVQAVRGVSLAINRGEFLALVGESGCGKSVTARAIMGLNPSPPAHITAGEINLCGTSVVSCTKRQLEDLRGSVASMVFQDPMTCLNPTMPVGKQITEGLLRRGLLSKEQCKGEALRLLGLVQIPQAELRAKQYPHQFSGGMRQRVMIAMALACKPKLLIADEPTTALDVTVQLQILRLLKSLQQETGTGVLLITHDLSVVANVADRVAVMYAGQIVEEGPVIQVLEQPAHPYTVGLLRSLPVPGQTQELYAIPGAPPDLFCPPKGCSFAPRCQHCMHICVQEQPPALAVAQGHIAACWLQHSQCRGKGELK